MSYRKVVITDKEAVIKFLERHKAVFEDHWLWLGACRRGYGYTTIENIIYSVSRLSLYVYKDLDIYNPLQQANHKVLCPHKACFNPEHLYVGSQKDNMEDESKKFASKTHFRCGHEKLASNIRTVKTDSNKGLETCKTCRREKDAQRYATKKKKLREHFQQVCQ